MMKILVIRIAVFFLATAMALSSYSQSKGRFYDKRESLLVLKQSILGALDLYPRDTVVGAMNFRLLMKEDYFDSLLFYRALDTLYKYDKDRFSNHYVMVVERMGYTAITKVFIRGYSKNSGKEVCYYLYPLERKGHIFIKEYSHDKRIFKDALDMSIIDELPESSDLLSISVYKKGALKTKIFQANNLTPEFHERIKSLLGDDL